MVARGYCVIAIDKCRAADPVATRLKTRQQKLRDLLSGHEPAGRHPATHEMPLLPASRAIREPALYQHQEGRD